MYFCKSVEFRWKLCCWSYWRIAFTIHWGAGCVSGGGEVSVVVCCASVSLSRHAMLCRLWGLWYRGVHSPDLNTGGKGTLTNTSSGIIYALKGLTLCACFTFNTRLSMCQQYIIASWNTTVAMALESNMDYLQFVSMGIYFQIIWIN